MKIGVLLSAYDCERYVEKCLEPWISLKKYDVTMDVVIAVSNGQWLKFKEAGVSPTEDRTFEILSSIDDIDFIYKNKGSNVLAEEHSRGILLNYLQTQECDLIWVVDGDEVYTPEGIRNTIKFIEENRDVNGFYMHFKNYVLRMPLFIDSFVKPTIYRDGVHGGLRNFSFDTDANYRFKSFGDIKKALIPIHVCFPDHYTWLQEDKRSFEKVIHQEHKFSHMGAPGERCAFKIDGDTLKFNEKYYRKNNEGIPVLSELLLDSNRLRLTINKDDVQAKIVLYHVHDGLTESSMKVYDENDQLVEDIYLGDVNQLMNGYHLWFVIKDSVSKNVNNLRVDVYESENIIHSEILHLNV